MPVEIGQNLLHYRIVEKIGEGGMGLVYRATDTKLGRDVALKLLPEQTAEHPDRLARFTQEAKTVAGLNHPNIVTLYAVDEADSVQFLTMELVQGRTLRELLPPGGFPLERFFELAIPVADAIAGAHAGGVTHRDLKPGNVMVTDGEERVKVLDFGLAKLNFSGDDEDPEQLETMTREGVVVGTPHYMSPEQARGATVDERSDIFSFGVMLYEMATGERPFSGMNSVELLSSVLKDEPLSVTESRPDLPRHLARVIGRCLEKKPADRYQTARDVLNELRALRNEIASGIFEGTSLDSLPSSRADARRLPTGDIPRRSIASRAVVVGSAVVVLAAVVTGFILRDRLAGDAPRPQDPLRRIVAVLPFENLGSADDDYFADGVTDEITSRLALIQGLGVISRTSARVYKGTQKSMREIGEELNADYILEGTIRWDKSADRGRVRISPRLIHVADDTHVWSETYEREITEVFEVQSAIASQIAIALDVTLVADERRALTARPTDNIEAYQAYLKGMELLSAPGFSRESFESGVEHFEHAVDIDSGFALAWAGLSSMHSRMIHYGFDRNERRLELAREAVDHALELQPDLAEAHLALGHYHYWGRRDYAAALRALDAARARAPGNSEIWLTTAYVKRRQGDLEGAIELFERDRELSPLDPNAAVGLGETCGTLRRYADGERAFKRGIALAPNDPYAYTELALLYLRWRGDIAAARDVLERVPGDGSTETCRVGFFTELLDRRYPEALQRLEACPDRVLEAGVFFTPVALFEGMTLQLLQDTGAARAAYERSLRTLEAKLADDPSDHRLHAALALTYAGLGRPEDAVRHGRRAVELYPIERDALQAPVMVIELALTYAMLGDAESAVEQLDAALSTPSVLSVAWLEADPRWDGLRGDSGFSELIRRHRLESGHER